MTIMAEAATIAERSFDSSAHISVERAALANPYSSLPYLPCLGGLCAAASVGQVD